MDLKYLFLLGRNETLSIAELTAIFGNGPISKKFNGYFEVMASLPSPQKFLDRLGGTLQILEVIQEKIPKDKVETTLFHILKDQFEKQTSKSVFSLNAYGTERFFLRNHLFSLKKRLKAEGLKIRFANKNFENMSGPALFNEKIIEKGIDLSIFFEKNDFSITKTVALQNIDAYAKRDYGKPFRDPVSGMLPPKLAQMMINMALAPYNENSHSVTVYDPFCGTGTILMEALLMGYPAIGSDKDMKMVEGTKHNIDWLRKNFDILKNTKSYVFQKDAAKIDFEDLKISHDQNLAMVSEPLLGPPLSKLPKTEELNDIMLHLKILYNDFFKNLKMWLKKGTPIVFLFPCFRNGSSWIHIDGLIEKIEALGYSRIALSQKGKLIYDRPDQLVGRVIEKFIVR